MFIITIIALLMVVVLMGVVLYLGYNLLKAKMANEEKKSGPQYEIHEEVIKRLQELNLPKSSSLEKKSPELSNLSQKHYPASEQYYCERHPSEASAGTCDICEKGFCGHCLKNHKNLHFCPEHLQTFLSNKWEQVLAVKTNPEETKAGVAIYNLKQDLWKENVPTYMETQYKIDIDNDYIESFVALFAREKDLDLIKTRLN